MSTMSMCCMFCMCCMLLFLLLRMCSYVLNCFNSSEEYDASSTPPVGYIELLQPCAPCKDTLCSWSFFWVLASNSDHKALIQFGNTCKQLRNMKYGKILHISVTWAPHKVCKPKQSRALRRTSTSDHWSFLCIYLQQSYMAENRNMT